ncbi:hypothetical protein Q8F55_008974 [Vanrija albida]|uniref:Uncharacterized protein n=1 Tax=Vanrija albida TaxID=181172 RepID=A0ABR3PSB4_9TREE
MPPARVTVVQPIGSAADGALGHLAWLRTLPPGPFVTGHVSHRLDPGIPWHRLELVEHHFLQRLADCREARGAALTGREMLDDLLTLPPGQARPDGVPARRVKTARAALWRRFEPDRRGGPLSAEQATACAVLALLKGWAAAAVPGSAGLPALLFNGLPCYDKERVYRFCFEIALDLDPRNVAVHVDRCAGCSGVNAGCWSYAPIAPEGACYPCHERGVPCDHGKKNSNQLQQVDIRALRGLPPGPGRDAGVDAIIRRELGRRVRG